MKRPLQLSLAIALALAGTNALALGLGPVRVTSKLNQPLQAEIPVIQGTAGEAEGLLVSLADQEDFERLGISRGNLGVPLEFSIAKDAHGQTVIRVTSTEPVRSTYLDFLIEANWPKGRMLREYTVLLDPPVTAPATAAPATVAAAPAAAAPAKVSTRAPAAVPAPVAAAVEKPEKTERKAVAHAAPAAAPAPARKVVEGEFGPTQAGQTLSAIAHETRQGGTDINQMMLALLKSNPDAFYRNNINALKRGVILRVPSADEVKAIGSATEAAQQVREQIEDWRGGRAATTRVASEGDTAAPAAAKPAKPARDTATASTGSRADKAGERLELVPPKAGKDSMAMADRPGASGAGSSSSNTEASRELARAKEALAASDQATGELKSRVKDLEDIQSKNERLISLKDSEIAELQQKLKELQSGKAVATAPAKPAADTTPIDKKDIWGDNAKAPSATAKADAAPAAATKPAEVKPADAKPAAVAEPLPTDHATAPQATPAADAAKPADATDKVAATTPATPPDSTAPTSTTAPTPAETKPLADAASTPATATPAAPAAVKPAPAKPASTKPAPVKPAARPLAQPAWYEAGWVKPAAIGGVIVFALLGLLGMRKRKAATSAAAAGTAPGKSLADSFGDSPFGNNVDERGAIESDVAQLQEQIAADPHNLGAHLELLSIFYAERDVPRFEEAAERMHAFVSDPHQAEWAEVQTMGEELAPHHPLWAQPGHEAAADALGGFEAMPEEVVPHTAFDPGAFGLDDAAAAPVASFTPAESVPDFGFGVPAAHAGEATHAPDLSGDSFGFDDIPPLEDTQMVIEPEPVAVAVPVPEPEPVAAPADDFFGDEDAVGTKLDLAKAYLDMGDPDGARSMLEEVVAEGSEAQRAEAQRLIDDLR